MNSHQRARAARERGDLARALMVAVNGLRRTPEDEECLRFLLEIFTGEIQSPGIEKELFRGIEYREDRGEILRFVLDSLESQGKEGLRRAIEDEADRLGVAIAVPPEPYVEPEPEAEAEPERAVESDPERELPPGVEPAQRESAPERVIEEDRTEEGQGERGDAPAQAVELKESAPRTSKVGMVLGSLLIIASVYGGVMYWDVSRESQRLAAVDEAIARLDLFAADEVYRELEQLSLMPGELDEATAERRWFVEALKTLDGVEEPPSAGVGAVGPSGGAFGLAARALSAAEEGDWEEAMAHVHHLHHEHRETLAAVFTEGRVCEAREHWDCALSRYQRVEQSFPRFIPARTGALRVAMYRFDQASFTSRQESLRRDVPGHPYAEVRWISSGGEIPVEGVEVEGEGRAEDHFLRVLRRLETLLVEISRGESEQALEGCEGFTEEEARRFPSVDLVCAMAAGTAADGEYLARSMGRALERRGLEEAYWAWLGKHGLVNLALLGFAEEAWGLAQEVEVRSDEQRLGRARILIQLGRGAEAREELAMIEGGTAEFSERVSYERLQSFVVEGNRGAMQREVRNLPPGRIREVGEAQLAFLEGRHRDAVGVHWRDGEDLRILRVQVLSLVADGRIREARGLLDSAEATPVDRLFFDGLRRRVMSRAGEEISPPSATAGTSSLELLVDQVGEAFWSRELTRSRALLDRGLELSPSHPELHWKRSLLARAAGNSGEARRHLQRAWRDDTGSSDLLVEIGRVHLDLGRPDLAREVFLQATFRDRRNLAAIAGLGETYDRLDRHRGRRDLVEVLSKISATDRNAAARAELLRWLAIVHGAREGEEGAMVFLERSRALIGDRPELLIEEGRYFQAREEWEPAVQRYRQALQRDPTRMEAHLHLAEVAAEEGDEDRVREHLDRIRSLEPTGELLEAAEELHQRVLGGR